MKGDHDRNQQQSAQRIGDSLGDINDTLHKINESLEQLRWQLVKDHEQRAKIAREAR